MSEIHTDSCHRVESKLLSKTLILMIPLYRVRPLKSEQSCEHTLGHNVHDFGVEYVTLELTPFEWWGHCVLYSPMYLLTVKLSFILGYISVIQIYNVHFKPDNNPHTIILREQQYQTFTIKTDGDIQQKSTLWQHIYIWSLSNSHTASNSFGVSKVVVDGQSGSDGYWLTLGAEREWATACSKKVMLAGSSIWSADCQSVTGSHFLQIREYLLSEEKEKLMFKKEVRFCAFLMRFPWPFRKNVAPTSVHVTLASFLHDLFLFVHISLIWMEAYWSAFWLFWQIILVWQWELPSSLRLQMLALSGKGLAKAEPELQHISGDSILSAFAKHE